jgi:ferritin-like metal-binding protein YciE
MSFQNLAALLDDQLQELHSAEEYLAKNLPELLSGVYSSELKSLLEQHIRESESHERKLAAVLKKRGLSLHAGRSRVVDLLVKRGRELVEMRGDSTVLDIGLLFILRAVETYEKCAYDAAKTVAEALDLQEVIAVLLENTRDEEAMERSCTVLSEDMIDAVHSSLFIEAPQSTRQPGGVA